MNLPKYKNMGLAEIHMPNAQFLTHPIRNLQHIGGSPPTGAHFRPKTLIVQGHCKTSLI